MCCLPLSCDERKLYGTVQHSFGLQLSEEIRPFRDWDNTSRVAERFDCGEFRAQKVGSPLDLKIARPAEHSPLARRHLTSLSAVEPRFVGPDPVGPMPAAFEWANSYYGKGDEEFEDPSLIFADEYDGLLSFNDFLVSEHAEAEKREDLSQLLLELMAHKRSRLFGFPLANRFVNVLLPHAVLHPNGDGHESSDPDRLWFMQPLISFLRGGRDRGRLRGTYSLTLFLVPVLNGEKFGQREMTVAEIKEMINAGWGFAAAHKKRQEFEISGPLFGYLGEVTRQAWLGSEQNNGNASGEHTLRGIVEKAGFGVGVCLAQGSVGKVSSATERLIGNEVVMSVGSARVSSVVVKTDSLDPLEVRSPVKEKAFPEPLLLLLRELSEPIRAPNPEDRASRQYRLDRPFVDDDGYAIGVLPTKRCLVVLSRDGAQHGVRDSALTQAGSIAYMTIGAATAIRNMRAIDNRLESLEGCGPTKIAEIDREIAADLSEIYDLDITRESYREIYRRLRDCLGITRDYKTLQDKMQALYRATSTLHEDRAQRQLVWLTAAIVILSVFILIGTVVVAGHGG